MSAIQLIGFSLSAFSAARGAGATPRASAAQRRSRRSCAAAARNVRDERHHFERALGWSVPCTPDLSFSVLRVVVESTSRRPGLFHAGPRSSPRSSVSADPFFGMTRRYSVVSVAGPSGLVAAAPRRRPSRDARCTLPRNVDRLAVARDGRLVGGRSTSAACPARSSDERRRRRRPSLSSSGIMLARASPQSTARTRRRRRADGAEVLDVDVGVVARRAVAPRCGRLHLRIEPVRERREAAEQQYRRPRDQPVEQDALRDSWPASAMHARSGSCCSVERALRGEDQLAHFAHGAACRRRARSRSARALAHRRRRVRHGHGEAAAQEQRQVRQVVADVRARRASADRARARSAFPGVELVLGALHDVRDAERLRAVRDRGRAAAGDPRDGDAGALRAS